MPDSDMSPRGVDAAFSAAEARLQYEDEALLQKPLAPVERFTVSGELVLALTDKQRRALIEDMGGVIHHHAGECLATAPYEPHRCTANVRGTHVTCGRVTRHQSWFVIVGQTGRQGPSSWACQQHALSTFETMNEIAMSARSAPGLHGVRPRWGELNPPPPTNLTRPQDTRVVGRSPAPTLCISPHDSISPSRSSSMAMIRRFAAWFHRVWSHDLPPAHEW